MNTNMSAVYISQTSHVIGTVTCNSSPSRSLAVTDLATPSFLLTRFDTGSKVARSFALPPAVCSVSSPIAYNRALFRQDEDFAISGNVFQGLTLDLTSGPASKLITNTLTVNIPTTPILAADAKVFAQIQGPTPGKPPQETCVITGAIPAGKSTVDLPLTILPGGAQVSIPNGSYEVILFVATFKPFAGLLTF